MSRTFPIVAVLLFVSLSGSAQTPPPAQLPWSSTWEDAFRDATEHHRLVFVDFYADWCGPCRTMESKVFPDPRVQQIFADFVLLRVNVDKGFTGRAKGVRVMPTYAVYDAKERERVRFFGGMPADKFVAAMTEVRNAAPLFLRAAEYLDGGREAEGHLAAGNGYLRLQMADKARDAYGRSIKAAGSDGSVAKVASAQRAYSWAIEGKPERAVKELQPICASTVSSDSDGLAWLLSARAAERAKNVAAARTAYEKVLAASPAGPLADQAKQGLANLK